MKHYKCPACKKHTVIFDTEYKIYQCKNIKCLTEIAEYIWVKRSK